MEGSFVTTQPEQPNENHKPVSNTPGSSSATPPILPYFLRLWKFVAIITLIGGTLGALPRLIAPLNYTGAFIIEFPPSPLAKIAAGLGADKDNPSLPLMNGAASVPQAGTAPEVAHLIMGSRKVIGTLVDEFKLAKAWKKPRDLAIIILGGKILFHPGEVGDLKVEYTDDDRSRAKAVVVRIMQILNEESARIARETTGDYMSVMLKGRAESEAELMAKLTVAREFLDKTDPLPPEQMGNTYGGIFASLLPDIIKAKALVAGKGAAVGKISDLATSAIKQDMDPNVSGQVPTTLGVLVDKKVALTAQLNLLKLQFNEEYPEVVTAQRQLNEYDRQLKTERLRLLKSVQTGDNPFVAPTVVESSAAKAGQAILDKAYNDLLTKMKALPARGVKYAFMDADVETAKAKVKFWREEEMKAKVITASRGHNFTVIDPPDVPERPNPRGAFLGFALGAALGLFFGSFRPYIQWYKALPKDDIG